MNTGKNMLIYDQYKNELTRESPFFCFVFDHSTKSHRRQPIIKEFRNLELIYRKKKKLQYFFGNIYMHIKILVEQDRNGIIQYSARDALVYIQ